MNGTGWFMVAFNDALSFYNQFTDFEEKNAVWQKKKIPFTFPRFWRHLVILQFFSSWDSRFRFLICFEFSDAPDVTFHVRTWAFAEYDVRDLIRSYRRAGLFGFRLGLRLLGKEVFTFFFFKGAAAHAIEKTTDSDIDSNSAVLMTCSPNPTPVLKILSTRDCSCWKSVNFTIGNHHSSGWQNQSVELEELLMLGLESVSESGRISMINLELIVLRRWSRSRVRNRKYLSA